ncbi:MAG TPA: spermidine/putrescine ABC transporter substrate-binding protein [Candidatus Limnocylindrales bacterium]|jgi:spermidine/putrescine-binding protein|nr:spermidine/putrescine ABC transporter substrate-binding protein [Candidatus Limnocylindrales bacterium]
MASREHEIEAIVRRVSANAVTRRRFLAATGFTSMAAFIAACSSGGGPSAAPSAAASAAPSAAPGSAEPSVAPAPSYATEGALFMYNWAEYIDLENIEEFKARYNIGEFTYDIYDSNESLLTKLDGGATGLYDISSPTAEFVKVMADKGYIVELPFDRIPNAALINPTFQNFYDPNGPDAKYNRYHIPKDWGTTGIGVRKKVVTEEVKTWKQFFEVAPKYSGRIVMVESAGDVMTAPLKALGYSLNSTDPTELGAARELLRGIAPHVLALDSNDYADKLATEEAVMGLVWTGGVVDLREEAETADTEYIVPEDGTLYWLDTWVQMADAPHPEAGLAWLNFIHEPAIQAKETETNRYATPNDEAKKLVSQEILSDPAVFVPDEAFGRLEGAQDVSTDPLRVEIWEEFSSTIGG